MSVLKVFIGFHAAIIPRPELKFGLGLATNRKDVELKLLHPHEGAAEWPTFT